MYSPIAGADDSYSGHEPLITPTSTMQRTTKLQGIYVDLRNDFLEEIDMVEGRIIKPATQAKDAIQPLKKIIKKRGDRKVSASQDRLFKHIMIISSLILRSTKPAWILLRKKQKGQTEITHLWPKLKWSWNEQRR